MNRYSLSSILVLLVLFAIFLTGLYVAVSKGGTFFWALTALVAILMALDIVVGRMAIRSTDQYASNRERNRDERMTDGEDRESEGTSTRVKDKRGKSLSGYCMVCEMDFQDGDEVVECPYCENLAHRAHMLWWLREDGSCPICRKQLDEHEFRE